MSIKNNTTSLQEVLEILSTKASGGEQATPEISVNSSNGLITATAGVKSSTYQMAFQPAKTITPSTASQVAVSSGYYTGGDITVAGDSNLVAGNIKSGVSIFGVSGTAQVGGEIIVDDVSRAIIEGTITSIEDSNVERIYNRAFYNYNSLTTINFPACTSIDRDAFYDCGRLTTISFPACTSLSQGAFGFCTSLTTASFPVCEYIGPNAFHSCRSLTTANFPACTYIHDFAFYNCYNLTMINFPVCSFVGASAFYGCHDFLSIASFPACKYIDSYAFAWCANEEPATVSFPVCKDIGSCAFYCCFSLTTASFPACTSIGSCAFANCYCLSSLLLGASSVCKLSHSNAFGSTPFVGYSAYFSGTPHIYVPSSLITAYQSATNWTYFSSYFSAIEDAPV